ncbi:MAG: Ldh family oxidoreductase [Treponema sp.]|jgi:LDH2 family malate/lactate/ureidoglycolate dehydrogenase|nr:Ldh family oxidoreductase [Treponema sp.]
MIRIYRPDLEGFISHILEALGIPQDEAEDSARILSAADARGVPSHGAAHLPRYAAGIRAGLIKGGVTPRVLRETPVSRVLDAEGGMGMSLSRRAMDWVIESAGKRGLAVCCVRNSNHFGIAGFYSEMAARRDMIGIALTNTAALGVPTFARSPMFGTNPIAFAAPALDGRLFSLDMATTAVTRGAVEICEREGRDIPPGWAAGADGGDPGEPARLLEDLLYLRGGGLLPLGGGAEGAGYKGYGLAVMVDILTALTSGGAFGAEVRDSAVTSARVCHFFMALRIDIFREPEDFKRDLSRMLDALSSLPPAEGRERVYYAGLRSQEEEERSAREGVPLSEGVWEELKALALPLGVLIPAICAPLHGPQIA